MANVTFETQVLEFIYQVTSYLSQMKMSQAGPEIKSTDIDFPERIQLGDGSSSMAADSKEVLRELHEFAAYHKIKRQFELTREFKNLQKQSMFEVKLILGTETYTGEGRSIKAAQRVAASVAMSTTTLPKPPPKEEPESCLKTDFITERKERRIGLLDDPLEHSPAFDHTAGRYFERRLKEILPTQQQYNQMHILLKEVEHCLKQVSDIMTAKSKEIGIKVCDPFFNDRSVNSKPRPDDEFRILKGVMRIGNMAKNVMLASDNEIGFVLLCARKPSVSLLNEICVELQQIQPEFCLVTDENEACLRIEYNSSYQAKVYLSSILLRNENFRNSNSTSHEVTSDYDQDKGSSNYTSVDHVANTDGTIASGSVFDQEPSKSELESNIPTSVDNDITDALPLDKCLNALAAIRHAKWFQVKYTHRSHALDVLRLIRDLQRTQPDPWAQIPQYAFELLLEHCATSANPNPPIIWIFRKLLEILSSGILYDTSLGVYDPCERSVTNVLANVSTDAKDAMTGVAQYCLRLLVFRRVQEFLGPAKTDAKYQ